MPLSGPTLAEDIKGALGFGSEPTSVQNLNMATSIVTAVMSAIVTFAPGTIMGDAPPSGGPLINGNGDNGVIVIPPGTLSSLLVSAFGQSTPQIMGMGNAIQTHIMTGKVKFSNGSITGVCTNTPTSPGVLTGVGTNGQVYGLDGAAMADLVAAALGQSSASSQLADMCNAITDHIMNNATVTLAVVTGVCSAGGGPIIGGTGSGGTIL